MKRRLDPAHVGRVKALACIVCGAPGPSDAHHIKTRPDGQTYGMGQKAGDDETIPLCKAHHQDGPEAFHNGPRTFRRAFGSELDLLAKTREKLRQKFPIAYTAKMPHLDF